MNPPHSHRAGQKKARQALNNPVAPVDGSLRSFSVPRYIALAETIQKAIGEGAFPVGSRLPPERDLARQFDVAYMTMRQALGLLVKKGMIARRAGLGTFVCSAVSRLDIAVACGPSLLESGADFYRAVVKALKEEGERTGYACHVYDGLTDFRGTPMPAEAPVCQQFARDLRNETFHGIVEISPGAKGFQYEGGVASRLPRVSWEWSRRDADLVIDRYGFGYESVAFLAGRGHRQIAYIRPTFKRPSQTPHVVGDLAGVADAVKALQLPSPTILHFEIDEVFGRREAEVFQRVLEVIAGWKADGGGMPDAMIVSDDIAMRAVALALISSGVAIPEKMELVTHAHEGVRHHYGIPVVRYEFSPQQFAKALLHRLSVRIAGGTVPAGPFVLKGRLETPPEDGPGGAGGNDLKQTVQII